MAKKESKKTRESQYVEILHEKGLTLADCMVLGFKFPDDIHAYGFHFDLMNAHVEYLLFDSTPDGTVIIVVSRESEQTGRIREMAERAGGTEYTPNLKQ